MDGSGRTRIRIPLGERFTDLWLFRGRRRHVLFDTGIKGAIRETVIPALEGLGIASESVEAVVVSHLDVDHSGDVGNVSHLLPNAEVIAHESDAAAMSDWAAFSAQRGQEFSQGWGLHETPAAIEWMRNAFAPGKIDRILQHEDRLELDDGRVLEVWHVPGHTRGHLALYDSWADSLAISDAILGSAVPLADGSPSFPPTYRHVDLYLNTIQRVQECAPRTLLTAHYGDFFGADVARFLEESVSFVHTLDRVIRDILSSEGKTLAQIVQEANPVVASWPVEGTDTALAFPVSGHLERMLATEEVQRKDGHNGWEWKR